MDVVWKDVEKIGVRLRVPLVFAGGMADPVLKAGGECVKALLQVQGQAGWGTHHPHYILQPFGNLSHQLQSMYEDWALSSDAGGMRDQERWQTLPFRVKCSR